MRLFVLLMAAVLLFTGSAAVLSQTMRVDSIRYRSFDTVGIQADFTIAQQWNPETRTLRREEHYRLPEQRSALRIVVFADDSCSNELLHEEFVSSTSAGKWLKSSRIEIGSGNDGRDTFLFFEADTLADRWVPYHLSIDETTPTRNLHTHYAADSTQPGRWIPVNRNLILRNTAGLDSVLEQSEWDADAADWNPVSRNEYAYTASQMSLLVNYEHREGRWQPVEKNESAEPTNGQAVDVRSLWHDGRWVATEQSVLTIDTAARRQQRLTTERDTATGAMVNAARADIHYLHDELVTSEQADRWDRENRRWTPSYRLSITYDTLERTLCERYISYNGSVSIGRETVYEYDALGNITVHWNGRYEPADSSWRKAEKVEYDYDLSLPIDRVVDRGRINDEPGATGYALRQKRVYRIAPDGSLTLKGLFEIFYGKEE